MKRRLFWLFAVAALVFVAAACGKSGGGNSEPHAEHAANGDLRETTASAQQLPSFLSEQRKEIQLAYQVAGTLSDTLQWIPCYCGCGESAGHKSNLNCFIHEIREDGTVVWDDHGTRCITCLNIALQSAELSKQGKSHYEIRQYIDAQYGKGGFAKPTDTPMPQA